jgi:hypothetical protein
MDSWLQRLVVRGVPADVAAFEKAAASPSKPEYLYQRAQLRTQRLSFVKLRAALPSRLADGIDEPQEPWDLFIEKPKRFRDGSLETTYRFQLSEFEPENLIAAVSGLYPRLTFVLGTVAPDADEQSSLLAHAGKVWRWWISKRLKESICAKIPEDTEDNGDEVFWQLVEADSKMMDVVIDHWKEKVGRVIAQINRDTKASDDRSSPKTSWDRISKNHRKSREAR